MLGDGRDGERAGGVDREPERGIEAWPWRSDSPARSYRRRRRYRRSHRPALAGRPRGGRQVDPIALGGEAPGGRGADAGGAADDHRDCRSEAPAAGARRSLPLPLGLAALDEGGWSLFGVGVLPVGADRRPAGFERADRRSGSVQPAHDPTARATADRRVAGDLGGELAGAREQRSRGATSETRPAASARSRRAVRAARAMPSGSARRGASGRRVRGSSAVTWPTETWGSTKEAASPASTRSASATKCRPPPAQTPLTAAITGTSTGRRGGRRALRPRSRGVGTVAFQQRHVGARAETAPAAVRTTQRTLPAAPPEARARPSDDVERVQRVGPIQGDESTPS